MIEKLMNLIPSKDLKAKIKQKKFGFSDMELVKLAYELSSTYDGRIENLSASLSYMKNEQAVVVAKKLLDHEKAKLEYLILQEDNTFYDVIVSERPKMKGEHFAFRTYHDSLAFIQDYVEACREDEIVEEDINIEYRIQKRYFKTYNMKDFDFEDDILAYCGFIFGGIMKNVNIRNTLGNMN